MSKTHFGFESVDEREKARRVRGVFDSVAPRYDLMNDLMSMGLHRAWKAYTVMTANVRPGDKVLDIAGGTGDLALAFAKKVGAGGQVVHTDINEAMLRTGRDRLLDAGVALPTLVCDAEKLPFAGESFDLVTRGLRAAQHDPQGRGAGRDEPRAQAAAANCWCWSFPGWPSRWKRPTTGIRSRCCRGWASWWPATTPATATWRSRSGCIRRRKS